MNKVKMNRCQLMAASFVGAELEKANLSGSNLEHADFQQIIGTECKFDKCNLVCAVFVPASFKLAKRKKKEYTVHLKGASFKKAIMKGIDLRAADLRGANFQDADLMNSILTEADLPPGLNEMANVNRAIM